MATAASVTRAPRRGAITPNVRPAFGETAFEAVLDALPVGVLLCTVEGDHANAELRRIWRLPPDDALDRTTFEGSLRPLRERTGIRRPGAPASGLRPVHAALRRRPTPPTRTAIQRGDGTTAVIRVEARPLLMGGHRAAVVTVLDETSAYEVERLRDAFLAIVGHELRSPISSVVGAADLLRRGDLERDVAADVAADLGSEAQRLNELVEQLIRLADLDRLGIGPSDEPVEIRNVTRRAIRRWHDRRPRLQIDLESPREVAPVIGEDGYVEQALDILLDNAAKFAGAAAPIVVRIEADEAEVRLHVLDGGPGIPVSGVDAIFELFHRGRREPNVDGPSGHGIGLFVARAIVAGLGGRMWATNRPEGGADVGFALPIARE